MNARRNIWCRTGLLGLLLLPPLSAADPAVPAAPVVPVVPVSVGAQKAPEYRMVPATWQKRLEKDVELGRIPGVLLLVESPEWGLRMAAAGRASLDGERPMRPDQPLRAGPVTRTMVAAALLQMEREWKLQLDDKITSYFGDGVHPGAEHITLRDCLRMSSGLYDYWKLPAFAPGAPLANDALRYDHEQIPTLVAAAQPKLAGSPGNYSFSATDYILAGLIAQKVDGKPLEQILQERVFARCGMTNSWLDTGAKELPADLVHGYSGWKSGAQRDRTFRAPSADWAAGAVISTPADLLRFWQTLFESTHLLQPHSYAHMTKFLPDYEGNPEDAKGMGLIERLSDRGTFRGIEGTVPGYYTCMGYYLHRDTYILLFINTSDTPWVGRLLFDNLLRQISGAPNRMRPADAAEVPAGTVNLQWSAGLLYGTQYAIFLGESFDEVTRASVEAPGNVRVLRTPDQRTFTQAVENLPAGKTYYWRVDALRERPDYELTNDRKRAEDMRKRYPELAYDFIPEQETIQGPVFHFTTR